MSDSGDFAAYSAALAPISEQLGEVARQIARDRDERARQDVEDARTLTRLETQVLELKEQTNRTRDAVEALEARERKMLESGPQPRRTQPVPAVDVEEGKARTSLWLGLAALASTIAAAVGAADALMLGSKG